MTLFPCIAEARAFRPAQHLRFVIDSAAVGWIRLADLKLLGRWPEVFKVSATAVTLAPELDNAERRTQALSAVIDWLAEAGQVVGWRNEVYAIRNHFDDAPLAFIERAASRFFGTMTYAVHLNGWSGSAASFESHQVPRFWIARRSSTKATDPGMLDNLVGGGIGWGYGVLETLLKESFEESGLPVELVRNAVPGRSVYVLRELPEGTQAEQLFVFDLAVPPDFVPSNQDGEVAAHALMAPDQLSIALAQGSMTVDAGLATLDCLARRGVPAWGHSDATRLAFEALLSPVV